ncbi:hypothetical protein BDZ89DRAFT_1071966, partial [Hymenopellis radicata]
MRTCDQFLSLPLLHEKVGRADSTAVSWHPQLCFSISNGLDVLATLDFLDFGSMERFCGDNTRTTPD